MSRRPPAAFVLRGGNWGLTTLFEGKGTFKDVYIATCYALTPYVILQAAMILLANVITAKEGAFYYVLEGLSLGWSGVLIICGMMQTHDYSLGKTLLFTIMTLLAMVVIIFLLLLFFRSLATASAISSPSTKKCCSVCTDERRKYP